MNIKQIFTDHRRSGEKRKMSIAQARPIISAQEADSQLNQDEVSGGSRSAGVLRCAVTRSLLHEVSLAQACVRTCTSGMLAQAARVLSRTLVLQVSRLAVAAVEQDGIVFLDEIDKIVVNPVGHHHLGGNWRS